MNNFYLLTELSSIEPWRYALALAVGALLGAFYFGGLWWTISRLQTVRQPGLLFLVSFWLRTVLTVGSFLIATGGRWPLLFTALAAFLTVRLFTVRRWGPVSERHSLGSSDAAKPG